MPESAFSSDAGLPLRGVPRTHSQIIIGHHLILHGYGHWLPNDPRGSGSDEVRQEKLEDLGPVHLGRKKTQPSRQVLKAYYNEAEPRLEFPRLWFDDAKRQAIATAIGELARRKPYTVWACAVLRNHAHLCVRRHRDDGEQIWRNFAEETASTLRSLAGVDEEHPVWSNRPYTVYLYAPDDVWSRVRYVENNPGKEGLVRQSWPFVTAYDGWPHQPKH